MVEQTWQPVELKTYIVETRESLRESIVAFGGPTIKKIYKLKNENPNLLKALAKMDRSRLFKNKLVNVVVKW